MIMGKTFLVANLVIKFDEKLVFKFYTVKNLLFKSEKRLKEKKMLSLRRFFVVTHIRLIWLDAFGEQVNHEEKSHADWTSMLILEQMNREERKKDNTVSFQSTNKGSMVGLHWFWPFSCKRVD